MRTPSPMLASLLVSVLSLSCTAQPATVPNEPWPVVTLLLHPTSATVPVGTAIQLSAIAQDSGGAAFIGIPITWTTSDASVASVGVGGSVNGLTVGSAEITATAEGKSDKAVITVTSDSAQPEATAVLAQLVLTPTSITLAPGDTTRFAVSGVWSNGSLAVPAAAYTATGGIIAAAGLYTAGISPGAYRIIALHTPSGLADTSTITVVPTPAAGLGIVTQPGGATSGVALIQQPVVELRNAQNQVVPQSGVMVTAAKASGSGLLGGTLTAVTNALGRATFASLTIAGSGLHTLAFSAPGLTSATSQQFTVPQPVALTFREDFETDFGTWFRVGCCSYSSTISTIEARTGSSSARFELHADDPFIGGSPRSERRLTESFVGAVGTENWYGLSLYVPADWQQDVQPQDYQILAQWHGIPDFNLGEDWAPPPLAIWIDKGDWSIWNYWDPKPVTIGSNPEPEGGREVVWKGALDRGRWTDWVVHTRWSYNSDGLLEIWKDGQLIVTKHGPNTYNDQHTLYFSLGLYKWPWAETNLQWSQRTRVFYADAIRMLTGPGSYNLVAP